MTAYPDTSFGPSPANYYVKRFYAIDREGGGNFRAHVYLRYDPSEVHPGVPEDSLRLWRTTNNGQTWIFVGGSVDLVNHLITADSVREFSKWAFGTPSSPTMSVREYGSTVPTKFSLSQNYPNPFNPNTKIQVDIPNQSFATLKVYNILGQEIATLLHGEMQAGTYEVEWKPDGLPSGVYLYRLQVYSRSNGKEGSYFQTRKMVLLR